MLGSINGAIAPVEELTIPVTDEGLVRGDGVFEVIRLYGGVPFALEDHYRRMEGSAERSRRFQGACTASKRSSSSACAIVAGGLVPLVLSPIRAPAARRAASSPRTASSSRTPVSGVAEWIA